MQGTPIAGCFKMENRFDMDDFGATQFQEISIQLQ